MYETEDKPWPEPEPEDKFDWSLSLAQIEKKYLPSPMKIQKTKRPISFRWDERNIDPAIKETIDTFEQKRDFSSFDHKFKKKYLYTWTLIHDSNPDLLRWLYENVMTKKEWTYQHQ